ncbi:transposase [Desulfovibrio sp. UIB00]|nr:transposase [Desulfovibrio sp. UIB00]
MGFSAMQIKFTRPGKPAENEHIGSVNGTFHNDCLNKNVFFSV